MTDWGEVVRFALYGELDELKTNSKAFSLLCISNFHSGQVMNDLEDLAGKNNKSKSIKFIKALYESYFEAKKHPKSPEIEAPSEEIFEHPHEIPSSSTKNRTSEPQNSRRCRMFSHTILLLTCSVDSLTDRGEKALPER